MTTRNVLHIQSGANHPGSVSRPLTQRIVDRFAAAGATVVTRDVFALPFVTNHWVAAHYAQADYPEAQQAAAIASQAVDEVIAADTIVIAAPIYNFSVPAALKAWIDQICVAGRTFSYSEEGPKPLLKDKKAYVVYTSGGVPMGSPVDFVTPYLKTVLGFIGITDVEFIAAEGLNGPAPETRIAAAEAQVDAIAA